jgi:hypothetical protein
MTVRDAFLDAAHSALDLIRRDEVAQRWTQPSALAEFSVGGLAAHLAHQVLTVPTVLAAPAAAEEPVPLLGHYDRAPWVGAELSSETNVGIRTHADRLAADGVEPLRIHLAATIDQLPAQLATEPAARVVRVSSGPWALRLDDFLISRMMEIAVHSDDLAFSVDIPTADLPSTVLDPVLALLTGLAVRRHGQPAVLRALARAERAPAAINAL